MTEVLNTMDSKKKTSFFVIIALLGALFIAACVWLFMPKYSPVLEDLDEQTAAAAMLQLDEQGIVYEVLQTANGSSLLVDQTIVDKTRVTLTESLGLPDVQGLELFDNADYSMTDFSQDVTYKRAIQGELARTISAMPEVKSARVHITLAPKRLFTADKSEAKASVFLEQVPDTQIGEAQVAGIKKLVANSVDKMDPMNVAVFNHSGAELSPPDVDGFANNVSKKFEAKTQIEQRLSEKAFRILSLFVDSEDIAISVDANLNFDQKRTTKQGFATGLDGQGVVLRQKESKVSSEPAMTESESLSSVPLSEEKETEYRHGQETEETVYSAGEIEFLSVGIALNAELSNEQLAKLKQVLIAGMGINEARGDTFALEVLNIPFAGSSANSSPEQSLRITPPPPARSNNTMISKNASSASNDFFEQYKFHILTILALLILGASFGMYRYNAIKEEKRKQLLLEVNQWLEQEDEAYA